MKGLADKPSYIIELLEGGVTIEDVIDGHICEQALVSSGCCGRNSPNASNSFHSAVISGLIF